MRLLIAHVSLFAAVAIAHTFVVMLIAPARMGHNLPMWDRFVMQLRGQLNGEFLIYTAIAGTGAAVTLYERYPPRTETASDGQ